MIADLARQTVVSPNDKQEDTLAVLREILSDQGLSESLSSSDEGYYFVAERAGEIAIYYNAVGEMREAGLLTCCRALARRGLTLSLFLSERTSALFVKHW
jgi:hypothetical protein